MSRGEKHEFWVTCDRCQKKVAVDEGDPLPYPFAQVRRPQARYTYIPPEPEEGDDPETSNAPWDVCSRSCADILINRELNELWPDNQRAVPE